MPEQTARGLRYPTLAEGPSFPDDFDRLAGDIDALLPRVVTGMELINPVPGVTTMQRVTFPEGLFTAADRPQVLTDAWTSLPGTHVRLTSFANLTAQGVDVGVRRTGTQPTSVMWIAAANGGGASRQGWQRPQYDGIGNITARPTPYLNSLQAAVLAGMVRVEAGVVEFTPTPGEVTTERVAFTAGKFDGPPIVLTAARSAWPWTRVRGTAASSISATGCNVSITRTGEWATPVNWLAIQPTASGRLWSPGGPANLPDLLEEFATNTEQRIPRIDSGFVPITPIPNEPTAVRVEFTPGRFTSVPKVFVTANTATNRVWGVTHSNPTATGADVWILRTDSYQTWVRWFAIEE